MDALDYVGTLNIESLEALYERYLSGDLSLAQSWKAFFDGFQLSQLTQQPKSRVFCKECLETEFRVVQLIEAYRSRGHLFTQTNPVRARRKYYPTLDIEHFGLGESHLDQEFKAGSLIGIGPNKLSEIIERLRQTYCGSVGCEYVHLRYADEIEWLKERIERTQNRTDFSREEKLDLYHDLARAVFFEQFITKNFPGQKSFSLEGSEALVPALNALLKHGSTLGVADVHLGMAHRGRLNVLANVFRKSLAHIFSEFIGKYPAEGYGAGDIKYHKGYSSSFTLENGKSLHVSLAPNPSHLEAVSALVEGMARARVDHRYAGDFGKVLPILIHGDAAMAAQGSVYEIAQMSGLRGYQTGGTVHVAINNQIGFTTNYLDGRTSVYCTDVAKVTQSPVFHVNADDVEAVVHVMRLALEYRQRFHRDVFVDLLGYRRHGHSETDEPQYTQPLLYRAIARHPHVLDIYRKKLATERALLEPELDEMGRDIEGALREALRRAKDTNPVPSDASLDEKKLSMPNADLSDSPETGVSRAMLDEVVNAVTTLPGEFPVFDKIRRIMDARKVSYREKGKIDWAFAELAAFGSLLKEGYGIRFSGQDSERGTFSQRHAVVLREDSEERYVPLNRLSHGSATLEIYNSPLSEYAVLGFEIGYAMAEPEGLTIWEAQFGDFVNNAQTMVDNFLSSSRTKWGETSGLVLLLPHGYEGQGPEHSSARFERFLQLSTGVNMQVVYPTTPASYFHVLRRQLHRPFRVPLVVLTPKSLLRHPDCVSRVDAFLTGHFEELIDDPAAPDRVDRVLLCSGKIYYDLKAERDRRGLKNVAIVRLEQLYPLPVRQLEALAKKYQGAAWKWVQEEPRNMGAWSYLAARVKGLALECISRPESDTPATGHYGQHIKEQNGIVSEAFEGLDGGTDHGS